MKIRINFGFPPDRTLSLGDRIYFVRENEHVNTMKQFHENIRRGYEELNIHEE